MKKFHDEYNGLVKYGTTHCYRQNRAMFQKRKKAALSERKFNMISSQKTSFSKNHKMNTKITKATKRKSIRKSLLFLDDYML